MTTKNTILSQKDLDTLRAEGWNIALRMGKVTEIAGRQCLPVRVIRKGFRDMMSCFIEVTDVEAPPELASAIAADDE